MKLCWIILWIRGCFGRLLYPAASTSFAGVELACTSAGVTTPKGPVNEHAATLPAALPPGDAVRPEAPVFRAYSSIGQSPRLIIGLLLVRTQLGPPLHLYTRVPSGSELGALRTQ